MSAIRKESVTYVDIDESSEGQRLDNFLLRICKGVPKSHIYRVVRGGQVRVNGRRCGVDYRMQIADRVRVPPLRLPAGPDEAERQSEHAQALKVHIPVLLEDEQLLVVNKPAGLAVHGGSGISTGLIEALRAQRPAAPFLELVHRLDRETSGILLVGKRRPALRKLHELFRSGDPDKRYLVLVRGAWSGGERHVRQPLLRIGDGDGEQRVVPDASGQAAYSIFRPLATTEAASLLEARIKTGRTHQIRVHLASLGYPVLGDEKYGDFELNRALRRHGLRRMFLHAWRLSLPHPASGTQLRLEAPLPEELRASLARIPGMKEALNGQNL